MIGREELIGDPRYDSPDARSDRADEVNAMIAAWTRLHTKHEAMEIIGAAGIPAGAVLDTLEQAYPQLLGTIRDHTTNIRRPFLRFFVCEEDWSHHSPDESLPEAIISGREPIIILGAIAGG